ncbi:hypothetical protein [Candidatus Chrysopegis kryptomonas]|uniref:Uncharacterized protein n=1 Tax=Candidatus Chryseopegocella kryptomonas TaxID=1633643 RepID=A0A0P1NWC2_9BACT|nr:hypothetical protein [Candidatus Chrysopegis kryptomonas]CUT03446.1 hypothetical protein JGI23_01477 [Candidatus Chrysopegis kryptomonas]
MSEEIKVIEAEISRFCGIISRVFSWIDKSVKNALRYEVRIFDIVNEKIVEFKSFKSIEDSLEYVCYRSKYGDDKKFIKSGYIAIIHAIVRAYTV